MTIQVLFIHGGGEGAYEADKVLATSLQKALGSAYEVRVPRMPDEDKPRYAAWKGRIAAELAVSRGETVVVGHSLGGSVALKYLAEEKLVRPVAGVFLIASPYWGAEDWEVDEYALPANFAANLPATMRIGLYHSRDDVWVPFDHLALYAEKLPRAFVREFDGRGHQFDGDLTEVAEDIKRL